MTLQLWKSTKEEPNPDAFVTFKDLDAYVGERIESAKQDFESAIKPRIRFEGLINIVKELRIFQVTLLIAIFFLGIGITSLIIGVVLYFVGLIWVGSLLTIAGIIFAAVACFNMDK